MSTQEQSEQQRRWVISLSLEHRREEISGPFAWGERVMPVSEHEELLAAARDALAKTDWDEEKEGCDCESCSAVRRLREIVR